MSTPTPADVFGHRARSTWVAETAVARAMREAQDRAEEQYQAEVREDMADDVFATLVHHLGDPTREYVVVDPARLDAHRTRVLVRR